MVQGLLPEHPFLPPRGRPAAKRGPCLNFLTFLTQNKKAAAIPQRGSLSPISAQKNSPFPKTRGKKPIHSSRSPDLRILSPCAAFSGKFPMTGFRRAHGLRAYSGGTVPDSHRIHYSPPVQNGPGGTQMPIDFLMILPELPFVNARQGQRRKDPAGPHTKCGVIATHRCPSNRNSTIQGMTSRIFSNAAYPKEGS